MDTWRLRPQTKSRDVSSSKVHASSLCCEVLQILVSLCGGLSQTCHAYYICKTREQLTVLDHSREPNGMVHFKL